MKTLKALVGVGLLVGAVWVGFQVIPPYFNYYRLEDAMKQEALRASYSRATEEDIKQSVLAKARELDIPLREEQIKVNRENRELIISAQYTVHIDLSFYAFDLNFAPTSSNRRI